MSRRRNRPADDIGADAQPIRVEIGVADQASDRAQRRTAGLCPLSQRKIIVGRRPAPPAE